MATVTKTITETSGTKATWTLSVTKSNYTVTGDTINIGNPSGTAKFVYSGKTYGEAVIGGNMVANSVPLWSGALEEQKAVSSGTAFALRAGGGGSAQTNTVFTSSNKTKKTLDISFQTTVRLMSNRISDGRLEGSYSGSQTWSNIATLTLNAPPIVTLGTPTYSEPHYNGFGTFAVPINSIKAQYGGDITSIKLTVGTDSVTQTYAVNEVANTTISLTPTKAGTFTPTITATDSRGQTSTQSLTAITVNQYNIPSVSFDVYRTAQDGVKTDEGEYALIKANFAYTSAVANLTAPSVTVTDQNGNAVTTTTTWYSDYDADDGVDPNDEISDWTTISSGAEVYGLTSVTNNGFSILSSYSFTITETDTQGKPSNPITQTLSTAFYTIDFQAGGKEIAFGGPANDDITDYNGKDYSDEGLFKCNMGTAFTDMTDDEVDDFVDGLEFNGGSPVETITPIVTATTGSLASASITKCGHVVVLALNVYNASSVASGGNIFTGTIQNEYRPLSASGGGVGYYGANAFIGYVRADGTITIRNASPSAFSSTTSSSPLTVMFTYIL